MSRERERRGRLRTQREKRRGPREKLDFSPPFLLPSQPASQPLAELSREGKKRGCSPSLFALSRRRLPPPPGGGVSFARLTPPQPTVVSSQCTTTEGGPSVKKAGRPLLGNAKNGILGKKRRGCTFCSSARRLSKLRLAEMWQMEEKEPSWSVRRKITAVAWHGRSALKKTLCFLPSWFRWFSSSDSLHNVINESLSLFPFDAPLLLLPQAAERCHCCTVYTTHHQRVLNAK